MNYRFATIDDVDLLVMQRLRFIDVNEKSSDYELIRENCYSYFNTALKKEECDAFLAEDGGVCIGTGIVFYYDSVPSRLNPTGKNAYVTSLYVEPDYRCKGIGAILMKKLLEQAASRGYRIIMLNASDMGKSLYEKLGFAEIHNGMILNMTE